MRYHAGRQAAPGSRAAPFLPASTAHGRQASCDGTPHPWKSPFQQERWRWIRWASRLKPGHMHRITTLLLNRGPKNDGDARAVRLQNRSPVRASGMRTRDAPDSVAQGCTQAHGTNAEKGRTRSRLLALLARTGPEGRAASLQGQHTWRSRMVTTSEKMMPLYAPDNVA